MGAGVKKTVVLTSTENFVWLSMQEIIPLIEKNWLDSARPGKHQVICRDVDRHSIAELMPDLLSADNIVFTCFTVKLARMGELLRKSFALESRYFIYLHNQATILCWPLQAWGMGKHLREDDVFISTSTADARTFRHSFEKSRVEIVPFTLRGITATYSAPAASRTRVPFVYVGRLSAQKNLHTLLYALRLLRDSDPALPWRLSIYGKDDHLGSPNMGMRSARYGEFLKNLSRRLGLEDRVEFKGYRKRAEIHRALSARRHIAVSASLHSDENFGMAQFRSLCMGNLAVLTRWGGYADFEKQFGDRVFLQTVEETARGPSVDPLKFARLLARAAASYRSQKPGRRKVSVPSYYRESRISARLLELAVERSSPGPRLKMTPLAKRILKKQSLFEKRVPDTGQIFNSYSDPDAKVPFRGYLMSPRERTAGGKNAAEVLCLPWVKLGSTSVRVSDPHRGDLRLKLSSAGADRPVLLTDWAGTRRRVSRETATRLLSLGYSHASGRRS